MHFANFDISLILHFFAGTLGALAIFLVITKLSGATKFSAPFGLVFIGILCASLAHFLSPWSTPVVLSFYALLSIKEL